MALNDASIQKMPSVSSISSRKIPRILWDKFVSKIPFFRKGGAAIMDQGLFAGSNFLINVLLARFMLPAEYGAFATAYAIFLLMGSFYIAILIEPMLVFGSGKYAERWHRYLGVVLYGHWLISIALSAILVGVAFVFQQAQSGVLAEAMLGLCIAQPFILMNWTLRRAFYVNSQPHWAASGGAVYLVAMVLGTLAAHSLDILSSFTVLLVIALASFITSVWFMFLLKPIQLGKPDDALSVMQVFRDHFGYGKWSAPTMLLTWIPSNIYYTILPLFVGLAGSAALKVSMNMIMPILHANTAISVLLAPSFVRALKYGGKDQLKQRTFFGLSVFTATCTIYWIILMLYGRQMVDFIGNGQYTDTVNFGILFIMGLIPLTNGIGEIVSGSLRAIGRLDYIFWTHVVSGIFTVTMGIGMLWFWGTAGAYLGLLFASAVAAVIAYSLYERGLRDLKRERIDELHSFDSTEAAVAASKRKDFGAALEQAKSREAEAIRSISNPDLLKVLIIDYNLNPNNQDGHWDVINRMAKHKHAIWILHGNQNRADIEDYAKDENALSQMNFVFFDLPLARMIKAISSTLYTWLWEMVAVLVAFYLNRKIAFDVAHQFYMRKQWQLYLLPLLPIPTVIDTGVHGEVVSNTKKQTVRQPNIIQQWLINRATAVFVADRSTQASMNEWCTADVQVNTVASLTNAHVSKFSSLSDVPQSPVRFISTGAVSDKDGLSAALDAFTECLDVYPDLEFWIHTDPELHQTLHQLVMKRGLNNNVWLRGKLTQKTWHHALKYCHAVIHSDLYGTYTPRLAEAMISQRPIILFATGANATWANEDNSVLMPMQSTETHAQVFKAQMLSIVASAEERQRLGKKARQFAEQEMLISKQVVQLSNLYNQVRIAQEITTSYVVATSGGA